MTAPLTSKASQVAEAKLRHPGERGMLVFFALLNAGLLVGAIWLIRQHPPWLGKHPFVDKEVQTLRGLGIAAIIAGPTIVLMRNVRHARTYANSIRLSPRQVPDIYDILVRHCSAFGMPNVPELYLSSDESHIARAYTAWGKSTFIVMGVKLLQADIAEIRDVVGFHLGREIGRIRLNHGAWWQELLLAYVVRIPGLRNPLMRFRAFSADRYGAFLQPDGVRGLLAVASGRLLLPRLDVAEYLRDIPRPSGGLGLMAKLWKPEPPIGERVQELYDLGLFTTQRSA